MKPRPLSTVRLTFPLASAIAALLASQAAHAASGDWAVDADGNWSLDTNWSSTPTVPGTANGDIIGLNNNISTSTRTVTIDTTSRTAGILNIGDSDNTHSFILAASGGGFLTLNNSGSAARINESGSVLDTVSSNITLADNLAASVPGNLTLSGIISGPAKTLTKTGDGTLILSGANTYNGQTTINAGTLRLSGGAFSTTARSYQINSGAVMSFGASASIPSGVATIQGTGTLRVLNGVSVGATGGSFDIAMNLGAGAVIDVQAGGSFGNGYQPILWTNNQATLNMDGTHNMWDDNAIIADALTGAGSIGSSFGGGSTSLTIGVANGSGTFSGTIIHGMGGGTRSIALTKNGTGTQTLSGANSYTGATTVNGGTLLLDKTGTGALASTSALALGSATFKVLGKSGAFATAQTLGALTTLNAGGSQIVLDANGGTSTTLTLANSAPTRAAGGTLAVDLSIANTVLTSTLGLAAGSQTNTQAIHGYATVKDTTSTGFATNVGGNIVRYTGADELLAASNSSTTNYKITPLGTTTSGSPLLTTATSAAYNSLSIDTSGASGANFLSLDGTVALTQKALLMTGNNDFTIQGGTQLGAAASEVIVHQAGAGTLTISSLISSGAGSLGKTGTGTLVLSGNNAYTGTTTISGGELRLSGGAFTTIAGRTYQIGTGAVMSLGASGSIVGGGNTTIQGTGTLRVLNGVTISGGSGTGRQINMNLGAGAVIDVQAGGSFGLGFQPIAWANNKATLNMDGTHDLWDDNAIVAAALTGSGTISATSTTNSFGGSRDFILGVENGSGTFNGTITATPATGQREFNLIKNGTGTQVFTGSTLFKGVTTINAGTLQYAKAVSLNAGNSANWTPARINVKSGATLALNVDSAGTNGFTATNLDTLLTAIYGGTSTSQGLQAGAILGLDTTTANGGTFTQGNAITNSTGTGGGSLSLTKLGTGTFILDKANTYTGSTKVSGGTLALGADNVLPDATSITIDNATLNAATFDDGVGTLDVTHAASTINLGSGANLAFAASSAVDWTGGTLNLTGTLNFSGGPSSSLRFGTANTGLTAGQLLQISSPGWTNFTLNASGYLTATSSGGSTYAAWQSANSTTQTIDQDHDSDGVSNGVEFFISGPVATSGFTPLPSVVSNLGTLSVTWTKAVGYTGVYGTDFVVETSPSLGTGTWTNEIAFPNLGFTVTFPSATEVKYTFPAGTKNFARLKVTGP